MKDRDFQQFSEISTIYSEIQHLRHQEQIHCLNRHILAHFLPQREDGKFAVEVGDVAAHDGASSELSGAVSLKGHVLLESSPSKNTSPNAHFLQFACRKSFSHQMSLHAVLANKEGKTGSQSYGKTLIYRFALLSLLNKMLGIGFSPSPWILCFRGGV